MVSKQDIQRLLDDERFQQIEERLKGINIFEVTGMGSWEIKHSNFIAWVLDPNASHGLGDTFVKAIISRLREECATDIDREKLSGLLEDDLCNAVVVRERESNIDLLFKTNNKRLVLCIENKVWSDASDAQLDKYHKYVKKRYGRRNVILFAFLTPDGRKVPEGKAPESYKEWLPLSYENLAVCLRQLLPLAENQKASLLITDYLDLLERKGIVTDDKLNQELNQLYLDHKDVFELVFQRQQDTQSIISDYLKNVYIETLEELQDEGILKECIGQDDGPGKYLWFTTEAMDDFLNTRANGRGSWKEGTPYSYWIYPGRHGVLDPTIKLELGPLNQPASTILKMNELKDFFAPKANEIESTDQFRRISTELTYIDEHATRSVDDIENDKIKDAVRNAIKKMLEKESDFFAQR